MDKKIKRRSLRAIRFIVTPTTSQLELYMNTIGKNLTYSQRYIDLPRCLNELIADNVIVQNEIHYSIPTVTWDGDNLSQNAGNLLQVFKHLENNATFEELTLNLPDLNRDILHYLLNRGKALGCIRSKWNEYNVV